MVFGYGSLVAVPGFIPSREPHERGYVCDLAGHRRRWNVAMDNAVTIAGYKYFVDTETGERPALHVAFLNVHPNERSDVNGLAFPVTDEELARLDARERNYVRTDVTASIRPEPTATVWAYIGSTAALARYDAGAQAGTAVVSAGYLRGVELGFERLGAEEAARFAASTDPPDCPVRALTRIDLGT
jgi:cation transport regulator ChaC